MRVRPGYGLRLPKSHRVILMDDGRSRLRCLFLSSRRELTRRSLPDDELDKVTGEAMRSTAPCRIVEMTPTAAGAMVRDGHSADDAKDVPASPVIIDISSRGTVRRRARAWPGMGAELVEFVGPEKVECRFRAPTHVLVAH